MLREAMYNRKVEQGSSLWRRVSRRPRKVRTLRGQRTSRRRRFALQSLAWERAIRSAVCPSRGPDPKTAHTNLAVVVMKCHSCVGRSHGAGLEGEDALCVCLNSRMQRKAGAVASNALLVAAVLVTSMTSDEHHALAQGSLDDEAASAAEALGLEAPSVGSCKGCGRNCCCRRHIREGLLTTAVVDAPVLTNHCPITAAVRCAALGVFSTS